MHVDADWGGYSNDRKSTTDYVIRLYGNVIHCKSKKQKCVTKASTFAEYLTLSEAADELIFIKEMVKTLNVRIDKSIKFYEDNSGTIKAVL